MTEEYKEQRAEASAIPALAYVNGDIVIFRPEQNGWYSIFSEQHITDERVNDFGWYLEPSRDTSPADVADGLKVDG